MSENGVAPSVPFRNSEFEIEASLPLSKSSLISLLLKKKHSHSHQLFFLRSHHGCQEFVGHPRIMQENGSASPSPVTQTFHLTIKFCFFMRNRIPFMLNWSGSLLHFSFLSHRNKRVCVDLSCWMVQLQNVSKSHACMKEKVYLRGLFHRLRALIALNCSVVFVAGVWVENLVFNFWDLWGIMCPRGFFFFFFFCVWPLERSDFSVTVWLWLSRGNLRLFLAPLFTGEL